MALGFLMTTPQPAQLAAGAKILGAHLVGLTDGGTSLPLLGWSTVGGDLRIPHFLALLTWQALRGQSIVHPDKLTAACLAVIVAGVLAGAAVALRGARTDAAPAGATSPLART
jgi:hypothetical protein